MTSVNIYFKDMSEFNEAKKLTFVDGESQKLEDASDTATPITKNELRKTTFNGTVSSNGDYRKPQFSLSYCWNFITKQGETGYRQLKERIGFVLIGDSETVVDSKIHFSESDTSNHYLVEEYEQVGYEVSHFEFVGRFRYMRIHLENGKMTKDGKVFE